MLRRHRTIESVDAGTGDCDEPDLALAEDVSKLKNEDRSVSFAQASDVIVLDSDEERGSLQRKRKLKTEAKMENKRVRDERGDEISEEKKTCAASCVLTKKCKESNKKDKIFNKLTALEKTVVDQAIHLPQLTSGYVNSSDVNSIRDKEGWLSDGAIDAFTVLPSKRSGLCCPSEILAMKVHCISVHLMQPLNAKNYQYFQVANWFEKGFWNIF